MRSKGLEEHLHKLGLESGKQVTKRALPRQKQEARGGWGSLALWQNGNDEAPGELAEIKSLVGLYVNNF